MWFILCLLHLVRAVFPQDIFWRQGWRRCQSCCILFIYLFKYLFVKKMFMVRIFFETLFGSSVQVKSVLDEILLNKSLCLKFSVWLLLDMEILHEFYLRERCQCKCNCDDSGSKFEFCWNQICLQDLWKRSIRTCSRVSRMHGMLASHFSVIKLQWLFRFSRIHERRLK